MSLKYPDNLEHNNNALPLVDDSEIGGGFHALNNTTERNNVPLAKRKYGFSCSFNDPATGNPVIKVYGGATVDNTAWFTDANWYSPADMIAADNGLTNNDGTVELGGQLNADTTVKHGNKILTLGNLTDNVSLGRVPNDWFEIAGITSVNWYSIGFKSDGTMYATINASGGGEDDIYQRFSYSGDFVGMGFDTDATRSFYALCVASNGDVYVSAFFDNGNRKIYQLVGGIAPLVDTSADNDYNYAGFCAAPNGDIYTVGQLKTTPYTNKIFKRSGGVGAWVDLAQTDTARFGIASDADGNIFTCAYDGGIYKQTGGTGNFELIQNVGGILFGIARDIKNDLYFCSPGGSGHMYRMIDATGAAEEISITPDPGYYIAAAPDGNMYMSGNSKIYVKLGDPAGMQYGDDYSAGNVSNPRWIPDMGAVTDAIATAIGGLPSDKIYAAGDGIAITPGSPDDIISVVLGETSVLPYRGDRGKSAYDHSQTAHAPANAEQNVNADWNAVSGDAQILNKPTITDPELNIQNGFPENQWIHSQLSVVDGTRTFTITPIGSPAEFHYYDNGVKYTVDTPKSIVFSDDEGMHWFSFVGETLTEHVNPTDEQTQQMILEQCLIGAIYWNTTDNKHEIDIFNERHGCHMSPETHYYLHKTRGAAFANGFSIYSILADQSGDLATHAQFAVEKGLFFDEDVEHEMTSDIAVGTSIPVVYITGSTIVVRSGGVAGFGVMTTGTGRLAYNKNTAGTWSVAELGNNNYGLYHLFTIGGITNSVISIMGQSDYTTIVDARKAATAEIQTIITELPIAEMIPLATVIFQTSTGYANTVKSRIRTTDVGSTHIDWRQTPLIGNASATDHNLLTNLQNAATAAVVNGHITKAQFDALITLSNGVAGRMVMASGAGTLDAQSSVTFLLGVLGVTGKVSATNLAGAATNSLRSNAAGEIEIGVVAASLTVPGSIELATQAETDAGTDAVRAITPATLAGTSIILCPDASATVKGKVELATDGETQTGTDTARAITPANLSARSASETRTGIAELATQAEVDAGTDAVRIITPATLRATHKLCISVSEQTIYNPADGGTTYFGIGSVGNLTSTTNEEFYCPIAGKITLADITMIAQTTAGSNENITAYIRVNGVATTIATVGVSAAKREFRNTALNITVAAGDTIVIRMVYPTWATNPVGVRCFGFIVIEG